jgi:hypothetical protein
MDRINELLARITELTAEELAELNTLIAAEVERLEGEDVTEDTVTALGAMADAQDAATAEATRRDEVQAALDTRREEALARLRPVADLPDEEAQPHEDAPAASDQDPAAEDDADADVAQPIAASAQPAQPRPGLAQLARRQPAPRQPAPSARLQARTTITRTDSGQELTTRRDMVEAMTRALSTAGPTRPVVSARVEFPAERMLRSGSDAANDTLVAAALSTESLVAAGGLCAPIENLYDVRVVGSTARPVRDALPVFGADRGGVNLRQPPVFQDWDGSLGDWTLQNDIDAATVGSPDPTKPILQALCPGFTPFYVEATTARVGFQNITARFDPEGTAANMAALDIAFARKAERKLLTKIAALSLPLTGAKVVSAARDVLAHIDRTIAWYQDRHRFDPTTRYHLYVQQWVRNMLRTDILRGAETDSLDALAVADEAITGWFARRNVNVTWTLDGRGTAQASGVGVPAIASQSYAAATAGSAIPGYPSQIEMLLHVEGDFVLLDAGEIDLGVVRDSTTNATNSYQTFKEEFFGVGFRGIEALQVVVSTEPTGQKAGYLDTSAVAD